MVTTTSMNKNSKHIMISYAWEGSQDLAYEVAQQLTNENIPVWMDIRNGVDGRLHDEMSKAVENSAAVCFFMTPEYQVSRSGRKELEYADKLEIPLIACRCRADFKPSGWLGLISAGLTWYDFRDLSDKRVNCTMNKLINYIQKDIFQMTPTVFPDLQGRTLPVIFRGRPQYRTLNSVTHSEERKSLTIDSSYYKRDRINDHRFTSLPDLKDTKEMSMPLTDYETYPLVSLDESIKSLIHIFNDDILRYVYIAKQNTLKPKDELTPDESAAIHLYSMQWHPIDNSLYIHLNRALRSIDRQSLTPWFAYLKLFLTGLSKLHSSNKTIWRGVKGDLSSQYNKDEIVTWWGVSSCAISVSVIEQFIGQNGTRTIFSIEATNAKFIREHSYFKEEDEIILPPGTQLKVIDKMQPAPDLTIIHLREIASPFPLVPSLFNNDKQSEQSLTDLLLSSQKQQSKSKSLFKRIIEQLYSSQKT